MDTDREHEYPVSADNRVLITQFPDDEGSVTMAHSDAPSDCDVTQYSPIIEEENGDDSEEERYSRLLQGSTSSRDKTGSYTDAEDHMTIVSHVTSKHSTAGRSVVDDDGSDVDDTDRGSEEDGEVEGEEEEDEDYADSMSMDNVSNFSSEPYEPPPMRDEDYDTDLEFDDDKWIHPEKYDHDTTGLTKYLDACRHHDVTPVRYFIKHMMGEHMKLSHYGLGPSAMKALSVPLEFNTTIERLELEGNWMLAEGVDYLCNVLKENVYVSYLKNSTLRKLKLRHNSLEDSGAQWIKEALSENESLEVLDISWNHFQRRGCVMIGEGLKENVGLKKLSVAMNGFGLEGAIALGEAIRVNRTLQELDASYCRLPLEGAMSLAAGLQANDTLQKLYLGYNSLGPEGTYALLTGLEKNESSGLNLLDLGITMVTQAFKDLQDRLESERELKVLHGGVMLDTRRKHEEIDPMEAFMRDPMTKLKEWVAKAGYRLIDLLRHFDRDNDFTMSKEEFIKGIKAAQIEITDEQIDILLNRLDTDGDGQIDFGPYVDDGELVKGDNEHRARKRQLKKEEEERKRMREEAEEADLDSFLRDPPTMVTLADK
nr:hypothetical protein BaRGS_035147 [Batillaria attramentaria]